MSDVNEIYRSKYLQCRDLKGKRHLVTIGSATLEEVGQERKRRIVLQLDEFERPFVLNTINARALEQLNGSSKSDDWTGMQFALCPDKTTFGGKSVDCIRVAVADAKPSKVKLLATAKS